MSGVTDPASPDRGSESRNARILRELLAEREAFEERWAAMSPETRESLDEIAAAFSGGKSKEERAAMALAERMREAAVVCEGCIHGFADGDVIHRRRGYDHGRSWSHHSYCEECVRSWHSSWFESRRDPVPCPGECGALVSWWDLDNVAYCSRRCSEIAARAKRRVLLGDRECVECETPFTPTRSDASYCSTACRMKAYRRRSKDEQEA